MLGPARHSIQRKLLMVVLATTGFALLLTGASMAYYDLRSFHNNSVDDLAALADILGLAAAPALQFRDPQSAHEYLGLLAAKPSIMAAAIYTANGELFAEYRAGESRPRFPQLPAADGYQTEGGELALFKRIVANGEILGTVYLRAQYDIGARLAGYLTILAVIMLLSLAAAAAISNRLQRWITGPISAVTAVARDVLDKRNFTLRAPRTTDDEIGVLVDAFNKMLDELGERSDVLERANAQLKCEVAERERAETARAASERRVRTLVSSMAQVVWTADMSGRFVNEQPSWAAYTGQTQEEYRDLGWRTAFSPEQRNIIDAAWSRASDPAEPFEVEIGLRHAASDSYRRTSLRTVPIVASGKVVEWVGAVTDIEDQRRAQDELRGLAAELEQRVTARTAQLEAANKELESFSYSVSHDLRAPLRAIGGFSDLLWADHQEQLDQEAQRKLGIIRAEAERMGELIDDLLAFSRLGRKSLQPAELDMGELARFVFERLSKEDAHADQVEFHVGKLPRAWADRALLEQVWVNLLGNAVKFSSKTEQPVIEIGGLTEKNELIYYVRDNGAGFDPRYQDKLFGVFQRLHDVTEFPGTGVGLALVQRIVVRHGGRVWADGRPGEGATFHFTLPAEDLHGRD